MTAFDAVLDRWNERREEPGLIESLRKDPATGVVLVHGDAARVAADALVVVPPDAVVSDAEWALIGARADGSVLLLAAVSERPQDEPQGVRWEGVREAAPRLSPEDADALVTGVALAAWMRDAPFCPRCGDRATLGSAGWSRRCDGCGTQHFPRTDPAVIVAIESPDRQRLLLGANAQWQGKMFSCFAGFVEVGESLESTVHREIEEEAGVRLGEIRFFGSQPWPYPRSLMVGFLATATDELPARPDGEEIIEVRWFTRDEVASALDGRGPVGVPGPASIARQLIAGWLEGA